MKKGFLIALLVSVGLLCEPCQTKIEILDNGVVVATPDGGKSSGKTASNTAKKKGKATKTPVNVAKKRTNPQRIGDGSRVLTKSGQSSRQYELEQVDRQIRSVKGMLSRLLKIRDGVGLDFDQRLANRPSVDKTPRDFGEEPYGKISAEIELSRDYINAWGRIRQQFAFDSKQFPGVNHNHLLRSGKMSNNPMDFFDIGDEDKAREMLGHLTQIAKAVAETCNARLIGSTFKSLMGPTQAVEGLANKKITLSLENAMNSWYLFTSEQVTFSEILERCDELEKGYAYACMYNNIWAQGVIKQKMHELGKILGKELYAFVKEHNMDGDGPVLSGREMNNVLINMAKLDDFVRDEQKHVKELDMMEDIFIFNKIRGIDPVIAIATYLKDVLTATTDECSIERKHVASKEFLEISTKHGDFDSLMYVKDHTINEEGNYSRDALNDHKVTYNKETMAVGELGKRIVRMYHMGANIRQPVQDFGHAVIEYARANADWCLMLEHTEFIAVYDSPHEEMLVDKSRDSARQINKENTRKGNNEE